MPPIKLKLNLAAVSSATTPRRQDEQNDGSHEKKSRVSSPYGDALGLRMGSEGRDDDGVVVKPTIRLNLGAFQSDSPSVVSSVSSTPMSVTPVSTPGPSDPPKKKRGRPPGKKNKPTAIPPHLVGPRTPRQSTTGLSTPMSELDVRMDTDYDDDPLSYPLSPTAAATTPVDLGTMSPSLYREGSIDYTPRQKWKRVKKPFNELANKVLLEVRRKDSYGFFLEPVNTQDYPDYLQRIGGEDKAMDFGTMQQKLDDGMYSTMDELETDFRKVITAALTFNLPGTMPAREANKILAHGMKHIDRNRPLVLTPTPSPSPGHDHSALPDSERNTPNPTRPYNRVKDDSIPPRKLIPTDMLDFPPNSLQAKAVAWNQTGGKRVRAKRFVRGRERFTGRWRDWTADGSRDIAEMDDPAGLLEELRSTTGMDWWTVTDWKRMRDEEEEWWEWDGLGGPTGQPPLPGADRLKRKPPLQRQLGPLDFGLYPQVEKEMRKINKSLAGAPEEEFEALSNHLRPDYAPPAIPAGYPPQPFVNVYERRPPTEFLYNVALGGTSGEAYTKSVQQFIDGAIKGAASRREDAGKGESEGALALRDYATNSWHDGVIRGRFGHLANDTVAALSRAGKGEPPIEGNADVDLSPSAMLSQAENAYTKIALRELTSPLNPLNLMPLLREPADFMYQGVGGKNGVLPALEWVSNEINRLSDLQARRKVSTSNGVANGDVGQATNGLNGSAPAKTSGKRALSSEPEAPEAKRARTSPPDAVVNGHDITMEDASTPANKASDKSESPSTATKAETTEEELRQLRLELVALTKFYPLASLKKMSKEEAGRLLPSNVRSLMTRSA